MFLSPLRVVILDELISKESARRTNHKHQYSSHSHLFIKMALGVARPLLEQVVSNSLLIPLMD